MSRVYFHTESAGEAELRGSERAYAGGVCRDLFVSAMGLRGYLTEEDVAAYLTLFPAEHYLNQGKGYSSRSIETAMAVEEKFFTPSLNTALVMGSDAVKFLARLHGQCEIHSYVEGPDRAWLAGIIERGRSDGVLRAEMGWEELVSFLCSNATAPVVMSYSVCDQFPNAGVAGWTDDKDGDGWYDLPESEQWSRAFEKLDPTLRLQPDTWADYYFGDGTTAFDLLEQVRSAPSAPPGPP